MFLCCCGNPAPNSAGSTRFDRSRCSSSLLCQAPEQAGAPSCLAYSIAYLHASRTASTFIPSTCRSATAR
eukprot:5042107-Pleurochrysis_carterae.AAC.4